MMNCLKRRPGRQIVNTVKYFQPWLYNPFSPFGVVVDKWSNDPLLPMHPYKILKKKLVLDVPWIVSHVNSEGLYPAAGKTMLKTIGDNSRSDARSSTNTNFGAHCISNSLVLLHLKMFISPGAAHGDDASYIFPMKLDTRSNVRDRMMSDLLVNIWLSFAKTGLPTIPSANWTSVSKNSKEAKYLKISAPRDLVMEENELGHSEFWDSLSIRENEKLEE
ncbi:hypothetical protein NQ318_008407 [Aromia moschata]|uniref:Carboxylesterase type B domain-containing protein n=1 Tax=Aromia moschata TaxID=1265417 RepID=A0AAV8X4T1_9CUCU|nr:hypothetical protein NQ318_008407 [Aromia moschata]